MHNQQREKGYALIIVLFAIVFITVITAVFLRGSLSNALQEKTLDENNLVVVSAESGTDYYTWELKQVYDEESLEEMFKDLVNKEIAAKKLPINYDDIRDDIVEDFQEKLTSRANSLVSDESKKLFSNYTHKLIAANVKKTKLGSDILLTVEGTVEGELHSAAESRKKKDLTFELKFTFPQVQTVDGKPPEDTDGTTTDGSLRPMPPLKTPNAPTSPTEPAELIGISKPANACLSTTGNIAIQNCYFSSKNEQNYSINESTLFVENYLTSWGTVNIENSFINIKNQIKASNLSLVDTKIVTGTSLRGENTTIISNSKVKSLEFGYTKKLNISGSDITVATSINSGNTDIQHSLIKINVFNGGYTTFNGVQLTVPDSLNVQEATIENSLISTHYFKEHGKTNFNKTDLKILNNYDSYGAHFTNSNLAVDGRLKTGGRLFYVEGSNVKIGGYAQTHNGSTIKNSVLSIHGYFDHAGKILEAEGSDIFVGDYVITGNGTDLKKVNMIVGGKYTSPEKFKIDDTHLRVGGPLTLPNGGELYKSLLIANEIQSDGNLKLHKSFVCVDDLKAGSLSMDDDSKVYYLNDSNPKNKNTIKLSAKEFEKTCGKKGPSTPEEIEQPGKIHWKPPVLDKVTY